MDLQPTAIAPEVRQRPFVAAVWVLLAAIFAHALLPVGTPMSKLPGSAFSAGTVDVSLQPVRSSTFSYFSLQDAESSTGADGADGPGPEGAEIAPAGGRLGRDPLVGVSPATASPAMLGAAGSWPQAARAPPIP